MAQDTRINSEELTKRFIDLRIKEYMRKRLRGRLVIEFSNGSISGLYDQAVIVGASIVDYYSQKIVE